MVILDKKEIQERMKEIDISWALKGKFIHREIIFKDFGEAFSFMSSVAIIAEEFGHHPNWKNVYHKVSISLSTHDANGLTIKDFQLAQGIDQVMKNLIQNNT